MSTNNIVPNNKVDEQKGELKPSIAPSSINGRFLSPMATLITKVNYHPLPLSLIRDNRECQTTARQTQ